MLLRIKGEKKSFPYFFFVKVFFVMNSKYCLFVHAIQGVFWGKLIITSINIEILRTNKWGLLQIPCKRCFRKKLIQQQQAKWVSFFFFFKQVASRLKTNRFPVNFYKKRCLSWQKNMSFHTCKSVTIAFCKSDNGKK